MLAVITLTADEVELVRHGAFELGHSRLLPSADRDSYEEQEWEAADLEGREPRPYPPDRATTFERIVSREWSPSITANVLLVHGQVPAVVAMAVAVPAGRVKSGLGRRLTIGPWHLLEPPLLISEIRAAVARGHRSRFRSSIDGPTRLLSPGTEAALWVAVDQLSPGLSVTAHQMLAAADLRAERVQLEALERRDANATALRLLTPRWRDLEPDGSSPSSSAFALEDAVSATRPEDDFVTDDSAVFPGWVRGHRPQSGWWGFRAGDARMWIKNVNVGPVETATGADLIYLRSHPAAMVVVQYKVLSRRADGTLYLQVDERLRSQMNRMLGLGAERTAQSIDDYRLSNEHAFLKLVDPQFSRGLSQDELTPGHYLPAAYAQQALDRVVGPQGGRTADLNQLRTLDTVTFTALVREAWLGLDVASTANALPHLRLPSATALTLAVQEPATGLP